MIIQGCQTWDPIGSNLRVLKMSFCTFVSTDQWLRTVYLHPHVRRVLWPGCVSCASWPGSVQLWQGSLSLPLRHLRYDWSVSSHVWCNILQIDIGLSLLQRFLEIRDYRVTERSNSRQVARKLNIAQSILLYKSIGRATWWSRINRELYLSVILFSLIEPGINLIKSKLYIFGTFILCIWQKKVLGTIRRTNPLFRRKSKKVTNFDEWYLKLT